VELHVGSRESGLSNRCQIGCHEKAATFSVVKLPTPLFGGGRAPGVRGAKGLPCSRRKCKLRCLLDGVLAAICCASVTGVSSLEGRAGLTGVFGDRECNPALGAPSRVETNARAGASLSIYVVGARSVPRSCEA